MIDQMAVTLYTHVRSQGWRSQVWSALTGRSHCLLPLAKVGAASTVHACRCARIQTVPISQIRGSEGRSKDFDRDFNPLQSHTKDRWLGIAGALQRGRVLPPVELIQVRDVYFVRDGHHRISVARALGQLDIEAKVTVWQVSGALPWERAADTPRLAGQEMGIRQLFRKVRDDSIRLREYLVLSLRAVVAAVIMRSRGQMVPQVGTGGA
jgi:hypothetical protein